MNVLILTPDAVGSTLLQRLITIYMQFYKYDRPVINLHELTNGLVKYYNPTFNQEVLGKQHDKWGYYQSLEEIAKLLDSVDHYKTSRLAHYHIKNRQDSIADQIPFYQYLNENFYIISCRRHNIFEHALSWCLNKVTKKLNVYNSAEKIDSFFELYRDGIELDPNSLIQSLNAYRDYVDWCNNHFSAANYFYYEEHLPRIEQYILNLPIFGQHNRLSWNDRFGMSFDQWNLCHYVNSDLGTLALSQPEKFAQLVDHSTQLPLIEPDNKHIIEGYNNVRDPSWPIISTISEYKNLPEHIRHEIDTQHAIAPVVEASLVKTTVAPQAVVELLPEGHRDFLKQHQQSYQKTSADIQQMVDAGIMISAPPIKKHTLDEKKHIIKNYQHLLDVYNQWIIQYPDLGQPLDNAVLDKFAKLERTRWNPTSSSFALSAEQTHD